MKDPNSKYYRGRYWPSEAPDVFFKPVPLMDRFKKLYYDPAHKLPLYNLVYHDCVVPTAHWNNAHYKYPEVRAIVALTEILYLNPPLCHFDLEEFAKRKKDFMAEYKIWSPLHREYGFAPMSNFQYLDKNKMVQQADYGDDCQVIVNFGNQVVKRGSVSIKPMSALIRAPKVWGQAKEFTPAVDK